jgi:hypothetical protein
VGRIAQSRWTFHVAATASGMILAAFRCKLLAPSHTAVSRLAFRHSSPTNRSGLLAITDAVGSSLSGEAAKIGSSKKITIFVS